MIRILTATYLERKMNAQNLQFHLQLIARELQKPTEALDFVFHEIIKPFFARLEDLIHPFLNPSARKDNIVLSLFSVFAQIVHIINSRHVLPKLLERPFDAKTKELLIQHITTFSMYGMNGLIMQNSRDSFITEGLK
ncbi:MAG: DUF1956 domain-containing protein [Syntrophobacterales bacterium]|nr:DUF1956 domain-containing protein [Syntrophobacterales bacterium]